MNREPYVLLTGAAGALGRAFATECASRGWHLALTDQPGTHLSELAAGLRRVYGVSTAGHECELRNESDRDRLFAWLRTRGACPTYLINVAGIDFEGGILDRTDEELQSIIRINVEATVAVTRAIVEQAGGELPLRVLTVSSLAAFYPMPLKATYAASKGFLLQFSRALREELRTSGGSATALCPAGLPTREESRRAIDAQGLVGRLTTVDVGRVAREAVNALVAGRPVCIPGAANRVLHGLAAMVPDQVIARSLYRRWSSARAAQGLIHHSGTVTVGDVA